MGYTTGSDSVHRTREIAGIFAGSRSSHDLWKNLTQERSQEAMNTLFATFVFFVGTFAGTPIELQQANPPASSQDEHHQGVNERGDKAMGFSHEKATHHFSLYPDGGAIEVNANEPKDTETRDMVRSHFKHIAVMFADGNFEIPMLVHAKNPPGAEVMARLKAEIHYNLEETPQGARIRIVSENRDALAGIHKFLVFQIKDHETGDTTAITKAK
jgi:hypothetical protein